MVCVRLCISRPMHLVLCDVCAQTAQRTDQRYVQIKWYKYETQMVDGKETASRLPTKGNHNKSHDRLDFDHGKAWHGMNCCFCCLFYAHCTIGCIVRSKNGIAFATVPWMREIYTFCFHFNPSYFLFCRSQRKPRQTVRTRCECPNWSIQTSQNACTRWKWQFRNNIKADNQWRMWKVTPMPNHGYQQ